MPDNQTRFIDYVTTNPELTPTSLARTLGVDRSYVYQLARRTGYTRVNKQWMSQLDTEQQGDLQFQTILEIRDMVERIASGDVVTTRDGVSHVPQGAAPAEATPPAPVAIEPWTSDARSRTINVPFTARPGDPLRLDEIVRDLQRWDRMNKSTASQTVTALLNAYLLTYYSNTLKSNN